ncbi:paraneoplastic antigen Ma1 homolog [Xyrauchen texanus]|uniref:paraneoplastic antigen Ma1 homolog n=1 Tax=Xyrauchen texanus TaxID=154827 RepID=UPI0022418CAE|nr:paraneoplastic antigen Ma1 homolog [Xyrauchen texanus]
MACLQTPFSVPDLKSWCRGEGIDPDYAIIVSRIPEETDVSKIEDTMHSIKALGRVRVRGRMYSQESQSLIVLCECREKVHGRRLPLDVLPVDGSDPWILSADRMEGNVLDVERESFVAPDESELREEHQESSLPNLLNASTPESIIRAVGELLAKTTKISSDSSSFRRLRTFSGITPIPAGEDNLENWMEQAMLMVEESDRSEKEKKLRIMESLRGPALEIIQAVRFTNAEASPKEYLTAIESAFGSSESGEDLYFKFRAVRQRQGECLSDFLRRLEKILIRVVQRGGLPAQSAGKARLEQLLRGATQSDIMLLQLRLRERKRNPPDFLDLLHEIREEEVRETERRKSNPTVRQVQVGSENIKDPFF